MRTSVKTSLGISAAGWFVAAIEAYAIFQNKRTDWLSLTAFSLGIAVGISAQGFAAVAAQKKEVLVVGLVSLCIMLGGALAISLATSQDRLVFVSAIFSVLAGITTQVLLGVRTGESKPKNDRLSGLLARARR